MDARERAYGSTHPTRADDLLEHTKEGIETLVRLGEPVGLRTSPVTDESRVVHISAGSL
jgi:hypothetical protein